MKRNIFKALLIALALPAAFVMTSCEKQPDSKELYVYLNTEIQPINRMELQVNVEIRKTGNVVKITGADSMIFNVKASRPLPASATCKLAADPNKLADYNKQFEANAVLLPEANVKLNDGAQLTIKEGSIFSADSLEIRVVNIANLSVTDSPTYVYPLSIVSVSSNDKGLAVSSNRSTIYVVVKVIAEDFTMSLTTEDVMTGAPLAYSDVVAMGASTSVSRMVDGLSTTAWNPSQNSSAYCIFDLKEMRTITGFRIWPCYTYPAETLKNCGIEVSDDRMNWKSQGYVTLPPTSGTKSNPIYQFVKFDAPITTKFVRMRSLSSYDRSYTGLSAFQLYVQ